MGAAAFDPDSYIKSEGVKFNPDEYLRGVDAPAPKQATQNVTAVPDDGGVTRVMDWAKANPNDKMAQQILTRANMLAQDKRISKQLGGMVSPETAGAITDASLKGANTGTFGLLDEASASAGPGDYKGNRDAFRKTLADREQRFDDSHGLLARGALNVASGLPGAMAIPAGYAGAMAGGALAGYGNSTSDTAAGQALDTGIGAGVGAIAQGVSNGGLAAGKKGAGWLIQKAGELGMKPQELLAKFFPGAVADAAKGAAPSMMRDGQRAAQMQSTMDDVIAANRRPPPVEIKGYPTHPEATPVASGADLPPATMTRGADLVDGMPMVKNPETGRSFPVLSDARFNQAAAEVNPIGQANADRVAPMQSGVNASKAARMRALEEIAKRGAGPDAARMAEQSGAAVVSPEARANQIKQINEEIAAQRMADPANATRRLQIGATPSSSADAVTKPGARVQSLTPDTAVTPMPERVGMQERMLQQHPDVADELPWNMNVGGPAPSQGPTPIAPHQADMQVDLPLGMLRQPKQKPMGAIDALSEFARMQGSKGEVKAAESAITPQLSQPGSPTADKLQKIIEAQRQNPDALAAFGVDPRKGERGFLDLGTAYAGYKGIKEGIPAAAKAMYPVGQKMANYGAEMRTPESVTKSWLSNPSLLAPLAQRQDQLGVGARYVLQGLQESGQTGLKSRLYILQSQPFFRAMMAEQSEE